MVRGKQVHLKARILELESGIITQLGLVAASSTSFRAPNFAPSRARKKSQDADVTVGCQTQEAST